MKVKGVSPDGGKQLEFESSSIDESFIKRLAGFDLDHEEVRKLIEQLHVSADVKSLLFAFSKASITVGRQVVRIGRSILSFICELLKQFPKFTFFALLGAVTGFLITSIPLLGVVLGPIITPIAVALGALLGVLEDLKDQALMRKITEFHAEFSPLR